MRFCIHVVDDDDESLCREKVTVHIDGEGWSGRHTEETDEDGNAFFESDQEDSCSFQLFIGKRDYGDQTIDDGDSLTFTVDEGVGTFIFTVHVVDADDDPVEGIGVTCFFRGFLRGHLKGTTDEDGNAEFKMHTSRDNETAEIYVDGANVGDHTVENGDSITFTLERDEGDDDEKDGDD